MNNTNQKVIPSLVDDLDSLGEEGMFYVLGNDKRVSQQFKAELESNPQRKKALDDRRNRLGDALKTMSGIAPRDVNSEHA